MKRILLYSLSAAAILAPLAGNAAVYERAHSEAPRKAVTITVELPMEMTPTADDINLFTIIDANADNKKWGYKSSFGGLVSPSNTKADCDDWAITPGIRFTDASTNYELAFTMKHNMRGNAFLSSFEFYIGTEPTAAGMTTLIGRIDNFFSEVANQQTPQSIPFALPGDAGVYYVGIRCITHKDEGSLSSWPCTFQNISIKAMESSAGAPAQPTDATITPGANGELSATVDFTMPTMSMNGKELPAQKPLTATLISEAETLTATALPGQHMSMKIATKQGTNNLTLQIDGDEQGEALPLSTYTGVVLPMRVHDLDYTLTPDNMTMSISWNPPTEGKDGGYVDFNALNYLIYISDTPNGDYRLLTDNGQNRTFSYTMEEGAQLRTVKLKVLPANAAGISTDDIAYVDQDRVYVSDMLGTPYALPAIERFDNLDMTYTPLTIMRPNSDYAGRWILQDPSACVPDENQSALVAYNPYSDDATIGRVALPKFSTKGLHNVAFTLTVLRYGSNSSYMRVYALNYYTEEPVLIGTINCSGATDWTEVNYPLPAEFQDKDWVQLYIDADLEEPQYVYAIDSYKLAVAAASDVALLGLDPSAPLIPGQPSDINIRLANFGFSSASPAVECKVTDSDGQILHTATLAPTAIESGKETVLTFSYTPKAPQADKVLTFTATITTPDEVPGNDTFVRNLHVRKPELPAVTDLTATSTEAGVLLEWSEPSLERTITESFETITDFYYGSELSRFKAVDVDGKTVYKFANIEMPNEQIAKAFLVVNDTYLNDSEGLEAHSGNKYLMATCPEQIGNQAPDPANDWLISPATESGSYVSFYLNIISSRYPETIRILTSSTGTEIADFQLLTTIDKTNTGWQHIEFRMPANARYFAINYVSQNMFGIMIDDITFRSTDELHSISGYNIYRDGTLLANVAEPGYTDTTAAPETTYRYHITAVSTAEGIESNPVDVTTIAAGMHDITVAPTVSTLPGLIRILDADAHVTVSDVAGMCIYSSEAADHIDIKTNPGAYIVGIGTRTYKVMVR